MPSVNSSSRLRITLCILALAVTVPFLQPTHSPPLNSFWAEWWALVLGLAATIPTFLSTSAWQPCRLPHLILLPAALVAVVLVQAVFGDTITPQNSLLYAAYLLWFAAMMLLGHHLTAKGDRGKAFDVIAGALLTGALVAAAIGIVQIYVPFPSTGWIFPRIDSVAYGNLGQRNHQTTYLWLGLVSALHLHSRGRFSSPILAALCLPLLVAAMFAGSRSSLLYALAIPVWTGWIRLRAPGTPSAKLFPATLLLLPALLVFQVLPQWLPPPSEIAASPLARLYHEVSSSQQRLALIWTAIAAIGDHPWLGSGPGAFPWASFQHATAASALGAPIVGENAHNIFFQLAVELGLPAALMTVVAALLWWRSLCKGAARPESWWIGASMAILALHSLLEYPLWYAYFGGVAALILGMGCRDHFVISPARRGVLYFAIALLTGGSILLSLAKDEANMEVAHRFLSSPRLNLADRQPAVGALQRIRRESLLSPWAETALVSLMDLGHDDLAERRRRCERAMRFSALREIVVKCAIFDYLDEDKDRADELIREAVLAYPDENSLTLDELAKAEKAFPEVAPLRVVATTAL